MCDLTYAIQLYAVYYLGLLSDVSVFPEVDSTL